MTAPLVEVRGLERRYAVGAEEVRALDGIDLVIERGEHVAVTGPSGSGKSTLLHVLGCLERPGAGSYHFEGRDVTHLDDRALSRLRGASIGFVFQTFCLVPELTVLENVTLPFPYRGTPDAAARERALSALDRVGLTPRLRHRPDELSGGEMQRVALARAIAPDPALLLADEPTGNLDSKTGAQILELLESLRADGTTLVVVTHDEAVAGRAARRVRLADGRVA